MNLDLTAEESQELSQSLMYSKKRIDEIPIGPDGYSSYEIKRNKLNVIESLIDKVRKAKS